MISKFHALLIGLCLMFALGGMGVRAQNTSLWTDCHLKGLDRWGDCSRASLDVVAVYGRSTLGGLAFRADVMNRTAGDTSGQLVLAVDYQEGGRQTFPSNGAIETHLAWDLLLKFDLNGTATLLDTAFQSQASSILNWEASAPLDYFDMEIDSALFSGSDGNWRVQVFTLSPEGALMDSSRVFARDDSCGRGKLVLLVNNVFTSYGPHAVSWYDGFAIRSHERPGQRRGFKYLLDAFESHRVPMVLVDLRMECCRANEYLEINDRIRTLAADGLCEALSTLTYGHFMPWQPDDVDARAMAMMREQRARFDLPVSDVFFPYESMLTAGDLRTIQAAGFSSLFGLDQYRYWFGWLDDWSDMDVIRQEIESLRKIHRIEGLDVVFDCRIGNYQGFVSDNRWEPIDWSTWSEYDMYTGTDEGLHIWWRRILHDMAMSADQEQFFSIGTDLLLTPWLFPDVIENNIAWIAAHPWIEAVTFSDLLSRGWEVIDHGDLSLADDELLIQHPLQNDGHYNAYFPQFYDGGVADGHSPNVAAGDTIEGYADYVPYRSAGQKMARILGDDETPGSLTDEILTLLRSLPQNSVADLAWRAWFLAVAEQTIHSKTDYAAGQTSTGDLGGKYLHPAAKLRANYVNQVGKLCAAAVWADSAAAGLLAPASCISSRDFDLDGETEYVLSNDRVWCLFENDGGRLEFALAWSEAHGPVELVAPTHQHQLIFDGLGRNFEWGEVSALPTWSRAVDGCFVEDFTYPEYVFTLPAAPSSGFVFMSPDGSITKMFTLTGNTLSGRYELDGVSQVNPGFGFTVNEAASDLPDWPDLYSPIVEADAVGWQCSSGGRVLVDLSDSNTALMAQESFDDSPARQEMQERESYDDYPNGHWFNFPYFTVSAIGVNDFEINLTLGADPESSVHDAEAPHRFRLHPAFPNPFNGAVTVAFHLPRQARVQFSLFDCLGRRVWKNPESTVLPAGEHRRSFSFSDLASGVYTIQVEAAGNRAFQKVLLIK